MMASPRRAWAPAYGALIITALSACSSPEDPPKDLGPPAWQVALDEGDLDRAVLSVWGTGPNNVYAAGGPLGNTGFSSLALRWDGATFRELHPGGDETFWWVSGSGPNDVWMVGEEGRIARWDGAVFTEHASGTTTTIWGVYAFSPKDAWAVGGTPEGGTKAPNDIVLRWDGAAWSPETLPGEPLGRSLYKVWGTSSEDLYVVGEYGVIWHRKGSTWSLESDPPLAKGTLFTVHGCSPSEVYAVGGQDVLRSDGTGFAKLDVTLGGGVNGVSCGAPGEAAIVGTNGLKQRLTGGAWIDDLVDEPYSDLHAVWADGEGAYWAVGGEFISKPSPGKPRKGVIARYGAGEVATSIAH